MIEVTDVSFYSCSQNVLFLGHKGTQLKLFFNTALFLLIKPTKWSQLRCARTNLDAAGFAVWLGAVLVLQLVYGWAALSVPEPCCFVRAPFLLLLLPSCLDVLPWVSVGPCHYSAVGSSRHYISL